MNATFSHAALSSLYKEQSVTELILTRDGCQAISQASRSVRRRTDLSEACQMPTHSLSSNLLPLPTTVAMENGSKEQIVPNSDEVVGTWPSGSILGALLSCSISAVGSITPSVGVK